MKSIEAITQEANKRISEKYPLFKNAIKEWMVEVILGILLEIIWGIIREVEHE